MGASGAGAAKEGRVEKGAAVNDKDVGATSPAARIAVKEMKLRFVCHVCHYLGLTPFASAGMSKEGVGCFSGCAPSPAAP